MYVIIDALSDEVLAQGDTNRELVPLLPSLKESGNRPRIVELPENEDWQQREMSRFANHDYKKVPWCGYWWEDQSRLMYKLYFPHVSIDDPTKLAYTISPARGREDRQTKVTPRAFLERFYSRTLTADEITEWCDHWTKINRVNELKFATTEDEIEWVYMNGPKSCMTCNPDMYSSSIHPVRVYAHGDLQLAWLKEPQRENVLARVLVWPERKLFGRVYGMYSEYATEIRRQLRLLGYISTGNGSLVGARIGRFVEHDGKAYVCPYIDGDTTDNRTVTDIGDFLVIGSGRMTAHHTNGFANGVDFRTCKHCGETFDASKVRMYHSERDGGVICSTCYVGHYETCWNCAVVTPRPEMHDVHLNHESTERVCSNCYTRYLDKCGTCGREYLGGFGDFRRDSNGSYTCGYCWTSRRVQAQANTNPVSCLVYPVDTSSATPVARSVIDPEMVFVIDELIDVVD